MQPRNESAGEPVIARDATYHRAPDALRSRLRDSLAQAAREQRSSLPWRGFALGAACGVAAMLAWNVSLLQWNSRGDEGVERDVLAAHLRSVIADGHLTDVVSSDQHTVKPWFTGKLDFAPPVRDLSTAGFALAGGRLDYVGGHPVAALVYRYRLHTVNVFVWPAAKDGVDAPRTTSQRGYSLTSWRCAGMQYWAASDTAPAELGRLAEASCGS